MSLTPGFPAIINKFTSYHTVLNQSCEILTGVGPTIAGKLAQCGIHTLQDLLFHLPFRYQDRTRITPIQDVRVTEWCVIVGQICKTEIKRGKRPTLYCYVADKTGIMTLRFFHFNKQQALALKENTSLRAFGEVRKFSDQLTMIHPEYQLLNDDETIQVEETLTPIYPSTQGLTQNRLRQLIKQALTQYGEMLTPLEWLSKDELDALNFKSIAEAIIYLHTPPPSLSLQSLEDGSHPALRRLAFDELAAQRSSLLLAKAFRLSLKAPLFTVNNALKDSFLSTLPFHLTQAQARVAGEIENDLSQSKPMLRLVQGDVGSGKTVIAALSALQAIANGFQVALMAPTDLLSEQHMQTLSGWFLPLGITVGRLSGKMKPKERREILSALENNTCSLIIGTHALFQNEVVFQKLGLVIIDEQHRFGVTQRLLLQQKGTTNALMPHQLLMTATPIPRTLAMTQFAHLDLSVLDELPPGRTEVTTAVLHQDKREPIIARLQHALASGRQAYWVCTLIDDSETLQCQTAIATAQNLQKQLPNASIGLIHGRMKITEKEQVMALFKAKKVDLLVATTVIEVGVDVPNASLMIIENSERLGLAQLHQLRGRVGRGQTKAHCLLLYQSPLSSIGAERLNIMRKTSNGFIIAEKDLELRGKGEFLGTKQTGYRQYKIADLTRDHALLPEVVKVCQKLLVRNHALARILTERWLGECKHYLQS